MVKPGEGVIAAMGNFDGVHPGHCALIKETIVFASENGASVGAVLFEPHPRRYFRPEDPPFLLTSSAQRDELLRAAGAETVIALTFDKALASQSPGEFVRGMLKDRLGLAGVVVGADFRFGSFRAGDAAALQKLGGEAGLKVRIVTLLAHEGAEKFGSSAARNALRAGNVKLAAELLGRPWSVQGKVLEGQKLGRTLGFSTANLTLGDLIEPRKGVYATRARLGDKIYDAVSNFGRRPTVGESAPLLETHLFGFSGDLYGEEIEVAFIDFIRDERKFDGLDALKAQIAADCETAKTRLAAA